MLREEMGKIISDGLCKSLVEIFEKEDIKFSDVTKSEVYDWDILVSMAVDLFVRIVEQNNKVWTAVKAYLKEHLPSYKVVDIREKSAYPEDSHLFMVSAQKDDGTFAVWTCWNQEMQTLNHGHYNLPHHDDCVEIFEAYYTPQKEE